MQYSTKSNIALFEGFCRKSQVDNRHIIAKVDDIPLYLKVASTDESKSKGYRGMVEPTSSDGILFVYESEDIIAFWMKGVPFPLDIMFFNRDLEMVNSFTMESYDQNISAKIYNSETPAQYAIEVRQGWISENIDKSKTIKLKF